MTKKNKEELVASLTKSFQESNYIAVCNYKGSKVKNLETLRNTARPLDIGIKVVKNKLAGIALKNAGHKEVELKDNNIFIWANDQINLSKTISQFASSNADSFSVKFGYYDGEVVDAKHIDTISKLPNKEELIGMLLSIWNAPARYFVTGMDNLRKQKEGA